jgi:hypothetical protein
MRIKDLLLIFCAKNSKLKYTILSMSKPVYFWTFSIFKMSNASSQKCLSIFHLNLLFQMILADYISCQWLQTFRDKWKQKCISANNAEAIEILYEVQ